MQKQGKKSDFDEDSKKTNSFLNMFAPIQKYNLQNQTYHGLQRRSGHAGDNILLVLSHSRLFSGRFFGKVQIVILIVDCIGNAAQQRWTGFDFCDRYDIL